MGRASTRHPCDAIAIICACGAARRSPQSARRSATSPFPAVPCPHWLACASWVRRRAALRPVPHPRPARRRTRGSLEPQTHLHGCPYRRACPHPPSPSRSGSTNSSGPANVCATDRAVGEHVWCGVVGDTITCTGQQEGHMDRDDQQTPQQPLPDERTSPFSEDAWTLFIISLALLLLLKMA